MRIRAILLGVILVSCSRGVPVDRPDPSAEAVRPEHIRAFLDGYFGSWSRGDMEAYGAHFFPEATVAHLADHRVSWVMRLGPFLDSQRRVFAQPGKKPVERYTDFVAEVDDDAASVTAWWRLENARGVTTGVDRFVLARDFNGDWRIVSLLFYDR